MHDDKNEESGSMMPPYDMPAGDGEPPKEGTTVTAGAPKNPNVPSATEDAVIVFIVCDRGDRYLSTGVFPA